MKPIRRNLLFSAATEQGTMQWLISYTENFRETPGCEMCIKLCSANNRKAAAYGSVTQQQIHVRNFRQQTS